VEGHSAGPSQKDHTPRLQELLQEARSVRRSSAYLTSANHSEPA
jgi:hypothetical protein